MCTVVFLSVLFVAAQAGGAALPPAWLSAWREVPRRDRPVLIVHGIEEQHVRKTGRWDLLAGPARWAELGLHGIVCNVSFHNYLRSEAAWERFERVAGGLQQAGLYAWIYDEEGYPSGAAGGTLIRGDAEGRSAEEVLKELTCRFLLSPPSPWISLGAFRRDNRRVLILVNTSDRSYCGRLGFRHRADWTFLRPVTGEITRGPSKAAAVPLELKGYEVLIVVGKPVSL